MILSLVNTGRDVEGDDSNPIRCIIPEFSGAAEEHYEPQLG
jgi:hypothetical protein